ncbi:hypothetical protein E4U52_006833 [Claviceps spartinae]|nr:hypothetical protein E4U52_006833 [Claviceps spartinae]
MSPSEWGEIFLQTLQPGKLLLVPMMMKASHAAREAAEEETPAAGKEAPAAEEEGGRSTEQGQEDAGTQDNDAGDEGPEEEDSDEDILDLRPSPTRANTSTPAPSRPAARSSRNTPATPAPPNGRPNGQPNRMSRSLQQKRIEAQSSELSQVISNVFGPGMGGTKKHEISARSPGADDFEKASKDCQLLFEEFGRPR